jgi:CTP:molybdopterin cytidylyltransferase MocA
MSVPHRWQRIRRGGIHPHSTIGLVTAAVILAAGRSSRFGRPKALLPADSSGITFIARLVESFRAAGVREVLVVGRPEDLQLREAVHAAAAQFVVNADADRGQLSSLIAGINAADSPDVDAVVAMPVDIPLVRPDTIATVLAAFARGPAIVARATHQGRHGHPVIFGRGVFDELRRADPNTGAKAVVHAHASDVLDVEVDDPAVLRDIDTVRDYRELFGRDP